MMNKVHIFGDSISSGIGSLMVNYTPKLEELLSNKYKIENHSLTGTTIEYCLEEVDKYLYDSNDWIIVFYGNVDAQLRPNTKGKFFARIPKRYKQGGMLIPRPLYSKNPKKRLLEHCDNFARKILHFFVVALDGYEQWVTIDDFTLSYNAVVNKLKQKTSNIILISTVYLDDNYFPNTNDEYKQFNAVIQNISRKFETYYVDLYDIIKEYIEESGSWDSFYLKDHFHPNKKGYEIIASLLAEYISGDKK